MDGITCGGWPTTMSIDCSLGLSYSIVVIQLMPATNPTQRQWRLGARADLASEPTGRNRQSPWQPWKDVMITKLSQTTDATNEGALRSRTVTWHVPEVSISMGSAMMRTRFPACADVRCDAEAAVCRPDAVRHRLCRTGPGGPSAVSRTSRCITWPASSTTAWSACCWTRSRVCVTDHPAGRHGLHIRGDQSVS